MRPDEAAKEYGREPLPVQSLVIVGVLNILNILFLDILYSL